MKCQTLTIRFCILALAVLCAAPAYAQLVPGTGTRIDYLGDNFENQKWGFVHRMPKSSREQNERANYPMGYSTNRMWIEGPERGQPDHMKVVPAPEGALPGSQYALLVRTLNSGIPGVRSYDVQQDDLVMNFSRRMGTSIRPSENMSVVVRVYLPPFEEWENRSGPQFGFRIGCGTTVNERGEGFFARNQDKTEPYWPGIWIHFRSETSKSVEKDSAFLTVRGNTRGRDMRSIEVTETGWWTMGMSVTGDGRVHYYASPGVDNLTAEDRLTSQFPYGFRAEWSNAYFFNFCNRNDGRSWSTPFLLDDTQVFVASGTRVRNIAAQREARDRKRAEVAKQKREESQKRTAQKPDSNNKTTQIEPAVLIPVAATKATTSDLR
ncbi:MAG TPA: hypothetical protein DCY79_12575 [Planctomycetaceae bacterium]|nr:hypothetical protein [Planctomycetaceae bacterium]